MMGPLARRRSRRFEEGGAAAGLTTNTGLPAGGYAAAPYAAYKAGAGGPGGFNLSYVPGQHTAWLGDVANNAVINAADISDGYAVDPSNQSNSNTDAIAHGDITSHNRIGANAARAHENSVYNTQGIPGDAWDGANRAWDGWGTHGPQDGSRLSNAFGAKGPIENYSGEDILEGDGIGNVGNAMLDFSGNRGLTRDQAEYRNLGSALEGQGYARVGPRENTGATTALSARGDDVLGEVGVLEEGYEHPEFDYESTGVKFGDDPAAYAQDLAGRFLDKSIAVNVGDALGKANVNVQNKLLDWSGNRGKTRAQAQADNIDAHNKRIEAGGAGEMILPSDKTTSFGASATDTALARDYGFDSVYDMHEAQFGSSSGDRKDQEAYVAKQAKLKSAPAIPNLSGESAKAWLSNNGYGNYDKKDAADAIRGLRQDQDRAQGTYVESNMDGGLVGPLGYAEGGLAGGGFKSLNLANVSSPEEEEQKRRRGQMAHAQIQRQQPGAIQQVGGQIKDKILSKGAEAITMAMFGFEDGGIALPPQVKELLMMASQGQISQEQLVQGLMEQGVPQDMIAQLLQQVSTPRPSPQGPLGPQQSPQDMLATNIAEQVNGPQGGPTLPSEYANGGVAYAAGGGWFSKLFGGDKDSKGRRSRPLPEGYKQSGSSIATRRAPQSEGISRRQIGAKQDIDESDRARALRNAFSNRANGGVMGPLGAQHRMDGGVINMKVPTDNTMRGYEDGGMVLETATAVPGGGPVKKMKTRTKSTQGHNTSEEETTMEFDTSVPPMSDMSLKAIGGW